MRSKIIKDTKYRGYSLFESEKTKDGFYKTTIDQLIDMAERMAAKHSKVLALRIDVHSPQGSDTHLTSRDMTRIIENTKRNINNRLKHGKNAPDIQSIWTQEQTCMSEHPHYHLQISCNGNAIKNGYGIFHELNNQVSRHLKTDDGKNNQGLVHYCESNKGAGLLIDRNSPDFESQRDEAVRMSSSQNSEGDIRRAMVEADVVEVMIALPGQLFFNTQIPACLWFLTKQKTKRKGEMLFIDARKLGNMQQAKDDGATVAIYFESRLAKLELKEAELPQIDAEVDELTEDEEESQQAKLKSRWAALECVVGAEPRFPAVAKDLVAHYEERCKAQDGKAMLKHQVGFGASWREDVLPSWAKTNPSAIARWASRRYAHTTSCKRKTNPAGLKHNSI